MKVKVDYKCPDCGADIWTECNMYWDSDDQAWSPTEEPNGLFSFDQIAAFEWQGKKRFTLTED